LRICVTEDDPVVAIKFRERGLIAEIIAFHVSNRDSQHFALLARLREGRLVVFDAHLDGLADIL